VTPSTAGAWPSGRIVAASVLAVLTGIAIALVDSSPGFDATGISAVGLVAAAFATTAIGGRRPWLFALLGGMWVPLVEIVAGGSMASLLAFVFSGIGAALGAAWTSAFRPRRA
jgi:hypothetical protein